MKKIKQFYIALLLISLPILGFTQHTNLQINFKHVVGNKPLVLFEEVYTNNFNEPFVVNKFKFYISNIVLKGEKTSLKLNLEPKLIDEADTTTKQIVIPKPSFIITAVEFTIGVDSSYNVTGIQSGDLDPLKGMYWTWNSGYIFAKLEGQSDSSKAPSHYFSYHVGGYKKEENAIRKIVLPLQQKAGSNVTSITIVADILKWFNSNHTIKVSENPICHQQGKLAMNLADNYSTMFSIMNNN